MGRRPDGRCRSPRGARPGLGGARRLPAGPAAPAGAGLVAACALGALLQVSAPASAGLLDDATLGGSLNLWVRDRDRAGFDPATGRDTPKATNLQHSTGHATLLFESGWIDERIGLDLGLHAGWDASNRGAPGHEINFWNVDNPYDQRPRSAGCPDAGSPQCTIDGAAVYRAALKLRGGSACRAQLGLFQPAAPTALGVNWSFAPAYYRGAEAAVRFGAWELDTSAALYLVRDPQLFRAVSAQGALTLRYATGPYTWRAETTYSRAPLHDRRQVGNFVYRMKAT